VSVQRARERKEEKEKQREREKERERIEIRKESIQERWHTHVAETCRNKTRHTHVDTRVNKKHARCTQI